MTSPVRYFVGIDELNFVKNSIENMKTESRFMSIILVVSLVSFLVRESRYNKEMRDIIYWVDRNDRIEDPSIKNFTSQYCRVQYFLCQESGSIDSSHKVNIILEQTRNKPNVKI